MAPGFCTYYSPYHSLYSNSTTNPTKTAQDPAENLTENSKESVSTTGSKATTIPSHLDTPAAFCAPTFALAPALTSTKNLFQQLITIYVATLKTLE